MPGNSFIKFAGISEGESHQTGFEGSKGWIEIGDWSWDIEAETSFMKGGGAAVGKPTPGAMSWSHYYDKASPIIMGKIVGGTHFSEVELVMCKQTGKATPDRYFTVIMKQVFITKVSSKGGEDGSVSQDVEMVFKSVVINYLAQTNDGPLEAAPKEFEWDIAAMKLVKPAA